VTETFECDPPHQVGRDIPTQWQNGNKEYEYKQAHTELRVIPAVWREVPVEVVLCEAFEEEFWVGAEFRTETMTFQISPARQELTEVPCRDNSNVKCYKLIDLPAQSQSVQVKKLERPGRIEKRLVPEKRGTIIKCELVSAARVEEVPVAAVTRSYQVGIPVPGKVEVQDIPARSFQVTRLELEKAASETEEPGKIVWRLQIPRRAPVHQPVIKADQSEDYGSVPGSVARPAFSRHAH